MSKYISYYIFGINNSISGDFNFINGVSNEIDGDFNMAMGLNNKIQNSNGGSFLLGTQLDTTENHLVAVGHFNEDVPGATFVVGTGYDDENRVNSFTVMNDNSYIGINTNDPSSELHIVG